MKIPTIKNVITCMVLSCIASSCDGIFDGVYDTPKNQYEEGFNNVDSIYHTGTIFVDAHDYMNWIYVDLHQRRIDSVAIDTVSMTLVNEPKEWDFAIHRYDAKTNQGKVMSTKQSDILSFAFIDHLPSGEFVPDVTTDSVTVDMSGMMDGVIKKIASPINKELINWLNLDLSTMPPIYTLSNKVYILQLKDGTYAALKLKNFMSTTGIKGYMTIDYVYPLNLTD